MTAQMSYAEFMSYRSEIATLQRLIDGLSHGRRYERPGLEYRLEKVKAKIEGLPVPPKPKKLSIAFNGNPVIQNYGIDANFGTEATTLLSDSVRLTTAGRTGDLSATGQIPRSDISQPIITNVTSGSFGFVLQLPPYDDRFGISEAEHAVNQIQNLLRAANSGDDDELASIASSMHQRAVNKVAQFLDLMKKNKAWFTTNYEGNTVQFQNTAEIDDAIIRLNPDDVEQPAQEIIGTLVGIIPMTRRFELHPNNEPPIYGLVGSQITDPDGPPNSSPTGRSGP